MNLRVRPRSALVQAALRRAAIIALITLPVLYCSGDKVGRALDRRMDLRQYLQETWRTEQGLPQNTVQAIRQTRDGYIWVGTKDGLARFDGIRLVVFDRQNTRQFRHNNVRSLYEDRAGRLWVCTPDGLLRHEAGAFTAFTTQDGLASNSIWSVLEDGAGRVWVVTAGGLCSFESGKFVTHTARDGLPNGTVEAILEDRAGAVWVATSEGLGRRREGAFTAYTTRNGLVNDAVKCLFEDGGGRLWVGTAAGLSVYQNGSFTNYTRQHGLSDETIEAIRTDGDGNVWVVTPSGLFRMNGGRFTTEAARDGLPAGKINLLYADRAGALWAATASGLARYQNGAWKRLTSRDGMPDGNALSLWEDREGSLWVGTESGGLFLLKDRKFTAVTSQDGLASEIINAFCEDTQSNVWVGVRDGGLYRLSGGRPTAFTTRDGLASNDVLALCADAAGGVWVGTPKGLDHFSGGAWRHYDSGSGLPDDVVRSVYADSVGALWVGTRRGLACLRDGRFAVYTALDGLPSDLVGALYEGRDGSLWVGTLGGLSRFKDGVFTNYGEKEGLAGEVALAIYEDSTGDLWLGTNGNGLVRLRNGQFARLTTKDGLPDDTVYHITEDRRGGLWCSTNKGVFRLSLADLRDFAPSTGRVLHPVVYGIADGLPTREASGGGHPAGLRSRDGRLWFATVKGVAVIDPARLTPNREPPPVTVERLLVDDEEIKLNAAVELPPGRRRLEFYYTAPSFIAPQKVSFKYKLENFDRDWVEAGARRTADYTNVPSGRYRFRVIACNNDGVWNETGATFDFRVKPHFYETIWFYALCVVALGLGVWGWWRLRVRRMERQFAAVLGERNRLAREIHDTLAQGFAGVSVQLELVARLLAASPQAAKTHLDQARILVRNSLADARRSVWDLRSPSLEGSDLPTALAETAKRLAGPAGVQTQIEVSGTNRPLGRAVEHQLLMIGTEAINNALRHAAPNRIHLALKFDARAVRFTVRDDGRGFDATKAAESGHFGLIGMRERADQIGGILNVESQPGAGTTITVDVPLN